jgi:TPR repeat protein
MKMSDNARQYRYSVTYERKDALDASSFFANINEQDRGKWRVAVALFGIGLFAMGTAIFFFPAGELHDSGKGHLGIFMAAAIALSWSVDPAFRDFTRRLWLPRGRALTVDIADPGITVARNAYDSRFTPWSDVASVTERADGVLLVFNDVASPVPGTSPLYHRFRWIIGSPILWLPTRTFISDEAKWDLRDFAHRFVVKSTNGDISFFRLHIATLVVMIVVTIASFGIPSCTLKMQESQLRRGLKYLAGDGVIRDDARGVELITVAATHDFVPAQYELGLLYMQGSHGVSKGGSRAEYWFRKAADAGFVGAQDKIDEIELRSRRDQPDYSQLSRRAADDYAAETIDRYAQAADEGDVEAEFKLGDLYESGYGVPKNPATAIAWYTKAANQGMSLAQDRLGHIYDDGIGVPRNSTEAINWYRKAAEKGEVLDQFKMGQIYSDGRDVPKDMAEAIKWYQKAATQGFPAATYQLRAMGADGRASSK